MIELIKLSREDNFSYCFHTAKVMNLFYKCDTLEYISYINTSIPFISKTLTSLNCWISLLSSSFMALQEKPGMNKSESSEFWAYIRPTPLASAPQPTLPTKRGQRFLNGPSRHSPYSFQRTRDEARPNVGRDAIERRPIRDRTREGVR